MLERFYGTSHQLNNLHFEIILKYQNENRSMQRMRMRLHYMQLYMCHKSSYFTCLTML
jgi:hypothetical protein